MASLSAFGSWLLGIVLDHGLSFLAGLISAWLSQMAAKAVVAKRAQDDKNQLEQAKTPEEKRRAAEAINSDTFGSS